MKHIIQTKQKLLFIFSAVFLLSLAAALCLCYIRSDTYRFHTFTGRLFKSELEEDTLSMHYTISNPDIWGIAHDTVTLPVYSKETQAGSLAALKHNVDTLRDIDCASLPPAEQVTYSVLSDYLETEYSGQSFSYYHEPLSPSSGVQSQMPILLAEYSFRTKQDIEDYLTLLSQIPGYLTGIITYEQEKSDAGLFMPDYSVRKVIEQCDSIMKEEDINNQTHFLVVSFKERLDKSIAAGIINESEKASYLSENDRILTTMLVPAYEKLADELTLLMGSGTNGGGLCTLPDGQAYYLYLLRKNTGSDKDIRTLKLLLLKQFQKDYNDLSALYDSHKALLTEPKKAGVLDFLEGENAEAMLKDLQSRIAQDFPPFPVSEKGTAVCQNDALPACTVKTLSPCLAKYASPAFYLTPPIDDISENSIYINPANRLSGISLYTTLAHEGYPGHLYQTVFYHLYRNRQDINPIRNILYFGGYVEGWALYVEMLSYEYAKESAGNTPSAILYEIERLDKSLQLGLYCLLDIAIHYDGASYEDVTATLTQFGITDTKLIHNLYEYIVEEPTTYLKYYIGYLEILELKERAENSWGSAYSDMLFHTLLLEAGPCSFHNIIIPTHVPGLFHIAVKKYKDIA